jgi:hypothetical protein
MEHSEREHPRYAHEATVTLVLGGQQVTGRTNNVSRGGLCVTVGDALAVGTDLEIDLALVFDDDVKSESLRLPARVVWCTPVDDAYQLGLSFRPHDAERARYLTLFLGYIDDARDEPAAPTDNVDERFR